MTRYSAKTPSVAIVSDPHGGSRYGLCIPDRVKLTGGDQGPPYYVPSRGQRALSKLWRQFWWWATKVTGGGPDAVVVNGDILEGVHHRTTTLVSNNLKDQRGVAEANLRIISPKSRLYIVKGTPAHDSEEGEAIESVAKNLNAVPSASGQFTRGELWLGFGGYLLHASHKISVSTSPVSEATALVTQLVKAAVDGGRWGKRPPDVIARAHVHRCRVVDLPTHTGGGIALTTPGWQLKTPHVVGCSPMESVQVGGVVVFAGEEGPYVRRWVRTIKRGAVDRWPTN